MASNIQEPNPLISKALGIFAIPAVPDKDGKPRLISQAEQDAIPPEQRRWKYFIGFQGARNDYETVARAVEFWRLVSGKTPDDVAEADIVMGLAARDLSVTGEAVTKVFKYLVMGWADACGITPNQYLAAHADPTRR